MPARGASLIPGGTRQKGRFQRGQALVETAIVVPLLLTLAFGIVAAGRVAHGQMAVSAAAREAARAAAVADTAADARARGIGRGREVAAGYGFDDASMEVQIQSGQFSRGGQVRGSARLEVSFQDLPLLGWARLSVASDHSERIDTYRSRWRGEHGR